MTAMDIEKGRLSDGPGRIRAISYIRPALACPGTAYRDANEHDSSDTKVSGFFSTPFFVL